MSWPRVVVVGWWLLVLSVCGCSASTWLMANGFNLSCGFDSGYRLCRGVWPIVGLVFGLFKQQLGSPASRIYIGIIFVFVPLTPNLLPVICAEL